MHSNLSHRNVNRRIYAANMLIEKVTLAFSGIVFEKTITEATIPEIRNRL